MVIILKKFKDVQNTYTNFLHKLTEDLQHFGRKFLQVILYIYCSNYVISIVYNRMLNTYRKMYLNVDY